jgi:hypothetical protein
VGSEIAVTIRERGFKPHDVRTKLSTPTADRALTQGTNGTSTQTEPHADSITQTHDVGGVDELQKTQRTAQLKALGVDNAPSVGKPELGASRTLDVLGKDRFAEIRAARVEGKLAWLNLDLARELGLQVPPGGKITPELEKTILDAFCYRMVGPGESAGDRPVVTMYADRYGGTGIVNNEGSGRAAFFPWLNAVAKGVGRTPLAHIDEKKDKQHAHGGAAMREGLIEAVWGEVNTNLFTAGSSRILAIIDIGEDTDWIDSKEPRALIIRAGQQLRPAAALAPGEDGSAPFTTRVFESMARELGLLVEHTAPDGKASVDYLATVTKMVEAHAKTAAEQTRFRVLHGAISTSNMVLNGAQLDLATMTSQPRTSNIKVNDHPFFKGFFDEYQSRADELQRVVRALSQALPSEHPQAFALHSYSVRDVLEKALDRELDLQMLDAIGFKPTMAQGLLAQEPELVSALTGTLGSMIQLANEGSNVADKAIVNTAVLDVFNLLRFYPAHYFGSPGADHTKKITSLLSPQLLGASHRQQRTRERVEHLVARFGPQFDALMQRAEARALEHYDTPTGMRRSIVSRAAFENEPIDRLYRAHYRESFNQAVDGWRNTHDPRVLTEAIDKVASVSVRSAEQLMRQGGVRRLEKSVELGIRAVDGVQYSVVAGDGGTRRLRAQLRVVGNEQDGFTLPDMPGAPHLSKDELLSTRYRFTLDAWKSTREVGARLDTDADGNPCVQFDIPVVKGDAGRVEGVFHVEARGDMWLKDGASNFRGYAYAVPDSHELNALKGELFGEPVPTRRPADDTTLSAAVTTPVSALPPAKGRGWELLSKRLGRSVDELRADPLLQPLLEEAAGKIGDRSTLSEAEARWMMRVVRARAELVADAANLPVSHVLKSNTCTAALASDDAALALVGMERKSLRAHVRAGKPS